MATSNSSSTSSPLGDCVICGTRTPTRCSQCASNGTRWMYFCSKEHQKILWPSHKRVCGSNSEPFAWPGFSKKEIEANVALCDKPHSFTETDGRYLRRTTLIELLGRDPSRNQGKFKICEEILADPRAYWRYMLSVQEEGYPRYPRTPIHSSLSVAGVRSLVHQTRTGAIEYAKTSSQSGLYTAFMHSPIDYLVAFEEHLLDEFSRQSWKYSPFWSTMQHKYYIFVHLLHRLALQEDNESQTFVNYSRLALRRYLSEVVVQTHPHVAKLFLDTIVSGSLAELQAWKKPTWA